MPKRLTYAGKLTLNQGHLLSIPSQLREAFNINAGDSLEMHVEGNMLVLKPTKKSTAGTSDQDKVVLFPAKEQPVQAQTAVPVGEAKFPLRLVEGRIHRVV